MILCISEIIDDLAQLVDKTDSRIKNETHRVKLLDTKSASCGEFSASVDPPKPWFYILCIKSPATISLSIIQIYDHLSFSVPSLLPSAF